MHKIPGFKKLLPALMVIAVAGCGDESLQPSQTGAAPGAPGAPSTWAYSGKTGIGTAYEAYDNGRYSDTSPTGPVSKVWFSIARGVITETMFGLIHEAQIKDMQFYIQGKNFLDIESEDTLSEIEYLHTDESGRPLSLAYRIVNRDIEGKYEIEKHVFTDPDHQTLYVRVKFRAFENGITPYLSVNPHVANTGSGDTAEVTDEALYAADGDSHLAIRGSRNFIATSAGFVGVSDGLSDLQDNDRMDWRYRHTGSESGNVALTAQLETLDSNETAYDFVLGFGYSREEADTAARATLERGYEQTLSHYNGEGEYHGWEDYLDNLGQLDELVPATTDGGKLLHASALVLKAQEDKTHAGALIASLSNPWGDTVSAGTGATGYKAVWPRDFYQCAMALLALGDNHTPLVSFRYLKQVQVRPDTPGNEGAWGWFLQKTEVDGTLEWVSVQLDQTAMPIMLGWKLWQAELLSDEEMVEWYFSMLKPAADFLVEGGEVKLGGNEHHVMPPRTQQERWEEQWGYSPSTTAAVIAGLVSAADMARLAGDNDSASRYLAAADRYTAQIESTLFTTSGIFDAGTEEPGDANGRYFMRLTQNDDSNDGGKLVDANGRAGINEQQVLDAGFLELVRYGVRGADNTHILDSLVELDDPSLPENLKVKYEFTFEGEPGRYPGWRRYGNDGYGEDEHTGANYGEQTPGQRGRVWPFFTGERGHYELSRAKTREQGLDADTLEQLRNTYVRAMELFANEGLMLPEQVWDGVGKASPHGYTQGEGTNSATPLAWTHAEYIKLVRSLRDRRVWDYYPIVGQRYSGKPLPAVSDR